MLTDNNFNLVNSNKNTHLYNTGMVVRNTSLLKATGKKNQD